MWDDFDYIAEAEKHGSVAEAARVSGIPRTTFRRKHEQQKKASALTKLGLKNIRDIDEAMPDNHDIKGTSTLYDAEGNKRLVWVKTNASNDTSKEHLEALGAALMSDIEPIKPIPLRPNGEWIEENCSVYTLADFHMGMYANALETGDTWNIEKAKHVFKSFFHHATRLTRDSAQAILLNLGDMSHTDGNTPHTTSRNHAIDVSGRFNEIRDALTECFDYAIKELLITHKRVHVIYCRGNHDSYTSPLIRDMIARKYEGNERVTFDRTDGYYHSYQWGNTSLFAHHGHKRTMKALAETFTHTFQKLYGNTEYRYGFCGHRHHEKLHGDEFFGIKIRQFDTLAPLDAHAAESGYRSECRSSVMVFHKEYGYMGERSITTKELMNENKNDECK